MKETKMYVDELPKSCGCCEFYSQDKYCAYCLMLNEKLRYIDKDKHCPLIDIKTHDRELVKEVCKKIKLKFSDTRTHNWGIEQFELYEFLDQIQIEVVEE